jgi:metal-responsive CopG/Arc/MetJ family transcriptional regulator|tara:strand:- start:377 stop:583 length:207 start_codon:yes stop_codon:yes gene_type:complete
MDNQHKREHNFRGQRMELISVYIPKIHLRMMNEIENESEEINRSVIVRKAVKEFLEKFHEEKQNRNST